MDETSTTTRTESAKIEVDPLHLVVAGTYADSSLDVVHGRLDEDLTLKLPGSDREALRLATQGVVLIVKEGVVLVAFGAGSRAPNGPDRTSIATRVAEQRRP